MMCRSVLWPRLTSILCAGFVLNAASLSEAADFKPNFSPVLEIPRITGPIKIDGELDDPAWQQAARATGFAEVNPGDQVEPPVASEAFVAYNEDYLYVALIAHDDPSKVRVSMSDRDQIFDDDYFGLMLDTYGNASWGYELFVNPLGIQGDLRRLSNDNEDITFDIIWESRGKVTDSGYQVEIAIPFSSLRFPDRPEQTWKANFWRSHQGETRRRYAWAALNRDNPCFMCQWGTLTGIHDIKRGKNLEVLPTFVGNQAGELRNLDDPKSGFKNKDLNGQASLNVRYGLSSNSTAEVTLNPDYSQVESDAAQIDVNTTFALFYQERRPFFQEGSDLFSTWINGVYTRSINNPRAAAKFTGQFGRSSLAYVFARDENSPLIVPLAQRSVENQTRRSTSNIVRAKLTFLEDSHIGLLTTNRILDGGGSGSTAGIDGRFRFRKNYYFEFQALGSYTHEMNAPGFIDTSMKEGVGQEFFDRGRHTVALDGEKYWGEAVYAGLRRSARVWNFECGYWEFSPTFRTDNGFTVRNDSREVDIWTGVYFRPNKRWLSEWQPSIDIGRVWDHAATIRPFEFDKGVRDEWVRTMLYLQTIGQTEVNLEYVNSQERFSGFLFPGISLFEANIASRPSEFLSGEVHFGFGRTIHRRHYREYDTVDEGGHPLHVLKVPDLGRGTEFSVWAGIKPTQRLYIQPSLEFSKLNHSDKYLKAHPGDEKEIFRGYILRTRVNYQFSREWFMRLIVQYDDFERSLNVEPLLTFRLNPLTVFYLGATSNYHYYDADDASGITESEWEATSRQYFFKVQYLFQM